MPAKKAAPKKKPVAKKVLSAEEVLIEKAAKDEVIVAKNNVNKKPLTERQKFHKFFREEYLKNIDLDAPHHPDKHGMLGYETNVFKKEIWSPAAGKYEEQDIEGFCEYCSLSQKSARDEYGNKR